MNENQVLIQLVYQALSGVTSVKMLRGADQPSRETGDIDFIVSPGTAMVACLRVAEWVMIDGWYVVSMKNLGYVCSITMNV